MLAGILDQDFATVLTKLKLRLLGFSLIRILRDDIAPATKGFDGVWRDAKFFTDASV